MQTVKRNAAGEITHILMINEFVEKDKYNPLTHLLKQIELDIQNAKEYLQDDEKEATGSDKIEIRHRIINLNDALELVAASYR